MKFLMIIMFWGMLTGLLAYRKNLNPVLWFVVGSIAPVIALLVLAFRKPANRLA